MEQRRILVTGATGYIGGRLVPVLLDEGHAVRCFVRDAKRLETRTWEDRVEVVEGDVLDPETLAPALSGIEVAYYLIHSLGSGSEYAEQDRQAAANFVAAAEQAGVRRIIYLGGINPKSDKRSKHLESRLETGETLREGSVPVTEFRAAVIVGSGSLSFELIRYLTERVPLLITPKWVRTKTQPIAVRNVLQYLTEALNVEESTGRIIEIGGGEVLSYQDMFNGYAARRGLTRPIIGVPVLTPYLSSLWVGLVTPLNSRIARPLIKGLDNEVIVRDDTATELFDIELLDYETAVDLALARFEKDTVETSWSDAFSSGDDRRMLTRLEQEEGMIQERLEVRVQASPSVIWSEINQLGGKNGWLYANLLWRLRGLMDLAVGGIGMRSGRRTYHKLREGDTVDFWRVEEVEKPRILRLRAEMKVPGRAWLQYEIKSLEGGMSSLTQTAFFEPKGLFGFLYWWTFYIPHTFIFPGMLRELRRRAERSAAARPKH
ncbi:MAG: SDR family oxidoreductase [Rhodothermales bacterium]|nr:SDR family oxidoreductase [Rhodothermales bacterium]